MLPDRVSNPGPLTYESGALPSKYGDIIRLCQLISVAKREEGCMI